MVGVVSFGGGGGAVQVEDRDLSKNQAINSNVTWEMKGDLLQTPLFIHHLHHVPLEYDIEELSICLAIVMESLCYRLGFLNSVRHPHLGIFLLHI